MNCAFNTGGKASKPSTSFAGVTLAAMNQNRINHANQNPNLAVNHPDNKAELYRAGLRPQPIPQPRNSRPDIGRPTIAEGIVRPALQKKSQDEAHGKKSNNGCFHCFGPSQVDD